MNYNLNNIDVDVSNLKCEVIFTFMDGVVQYKIKRKLDQIDNFINVELKNTNLLKCESDLISNGFRKDSNDVWHSKTGMFMNKDQDINLQPYFLKNGELIIKFGKVNHSLNLQDIELKSLKNFPTELTPIRCKGSHPSGYISPGIRFHPLGSKNNQYDVSKHGFSDKEFKKYYKEVATIPLYKCYEDKIDRYIKGEFENLVIKNQRVKFIDWYIEKNPKSKDKLYNLYLEYLNKLYYSIGVNTILKQTWPDKFMLWADDKIDTKIKNELKSVKVINKFKL